MTTYAPIALAIAGLALAAGPAEARGCLKGAVAGGVAGHLVGRGHAVVGAAAGCAVGHHHAAKQHRG